LGLLDEKIDFMFIRGLFFCFF